MLLLEDQLRRSNLSVSSPRKSRKSQAQGDVVMKLESRLCYGNHLPYLRNSVLHIIKACLLKGYSCHSLANVFLPTEEIQID